MCCVESVEECRGGFPEDWRGLLDCVNDGVKDERGEIEEGSVEEGRDEEEEEEEEEEG